jgi:hypothetical protein
MKILEHKKQLKISGITRTFLLCECPECKNNFYARQDHIFRKTNPIKSCGCLRSKRTGRKAYNAKPEGLAAAKNVFNSYKSKCERKDIKFEILFDEFMSATKQDCFYCGSQPNQSYHDYFKSGVRKGQKKVNGKFIYNGIDRIEPSKGYVIGNIRPCCRFCNSAKLDKSEKDFFAWVDKLIEFRKVK